MKNVKEHKQRECLSTLHSSLSIDVNPKSIPQTKTKIHRIKEEGRYYSLLRGTLLVKLFLLTC